MSSVSAISGSQSATASTLTSLLQSYDPLDTNKDGVVSVAELAAAITPKSSDKSAAPAEKPPEKPTKAAGETVSIQAASALLDVQQKAPTQQSVSAVESALTAYLYND